ncbi:MAG: hypothetical protein J2P38_11880, partial [Candidatus Dormibacteraeota bacterium]|nr:hypothetical protein [Candidatus Dormibacteraeota bacterium]
MAPARPDHAAHVPARPGPADPVPARGPGPLLRGGRGTSVRAGAEGRGRLVTATQESEPALGVEHPGLLTTIQDLGRPGHHNAGVPVGGAMDGFALAAGNLLVGNPPGAAGLEVTMQGPALVARRGLLVAITGADLSPQRNGRPLATWTSCFLAAG